MDLIFGALALSCRIDVNCSSSTFADAGFIHLIEDIACMAFHAGVLACIIVGIVGAVVALALV